MNNILFIISDNFIHEEIYRISLFIIPMIANIIQFIGLTRKNHFLVIPYIITTLFRIIWFIIFIYQYLWPMSQLLEHIGLFYVTLGYLLPTVYFFFGNLKFYIIYSRIYHMELKRKRKVEIQFSNFCDLNTQ